MSSFAQLLSEPFLNRLLHQGAALLDGLTVTPQGQLQVNVATYDDSEENQVLLTALFCEVLVDTPHSLAIALKVKGCATGAGCSTGKGCGAGGGCSTGKSCGSGGGCGSKR